jgi:undecaprenyl-diphosphatase
MKCNAPRPPEFETSMNLPARARPGRWRFSGALILFTAIWLAMLLWGNGAVDQRIYQALYSGDRPALAAVARFFTMLGEPTLVIAASVVGAVWLWFAGHRHLAPAFFAITAFARLFTELQKYWIARVRPELEPHLVVVKSMSFPSGHATSSMVFFVMTALVLTQGSRWRNAAVGIAVVLALLVGLSRVMLGVHWPSDVVGGWAFGLMWLLLTLRMADRWVARGARR